MPDCQCGCRWDGRQHASNGMGCQVAVLDMLEKQMGGDAFRRVGVPSHNFASLGVCSVTLSCPSVVSS